MKKSLLALATVASVASSIVLSPVVSAQDVYSETDQYRPVA